ncbi:MAG: DUF2500 domain-containing protein [Erysipelotrichaceae bacterium]|nr:DUF2500 domain-containing protein [Erysipelotrichaceae bacterium]
MIFDTGLFGIIFILIFFIVISMFIYNIFNGINTLHTNNHSPRLTVEATVVSKRTQTDFHHQNMNNTGTFSSTTYYYVTFEVSSEDRIEFCVKGAEYGMLVEGDKGNLTFQGIRYLGFERGYYA